jgi:hypothetical protein
MRTAHAAVSLMTVLSCVSFTGDVGLAQSPNAASQRASSQRAITHLNVTVRDVVNIESFCLDPDNSLENKFYFDRNESAPFSIPERSSFVVTDIIVFPDCVGEVAPDPNFVTLALVEGPSVVRTFQALFFGKETKHYSLTGGLAFPAGSVPRPRNTTFSSGLVQIQVLGYFVRGAALEPGEGVESDLSQ